MKLGSRVGFDECNSVLKQPHVTGQQITLPLSLCALHSPRRIALSSAENPQSGWLGSTQNGIARNSKTIDRKTTFLIKGTPGLWFWKAYSTNFPNQPDVLTFLCAIPRDSTKGFVFDVGEASPATAQGQISVWISEYGWYISRPSVSNCCSQGPGLTSLRQGKHKVLPRVGAYFAYMLHY